MEFYFSGFVPNATTFQCFDCQGGPLTKCANVELRGSNLECTGPNAQCYEALISYQSK